MSRFSHLLRRIFFWRKVPKSLPLLSDPYREMPRDLLKEGSAYQIGDRFLLRRDYYSNLQEDISVTRGKTTAHHYRNAYCRLLKGSVIVIIGQEPLGDVIVRYCLSDKGHALYSWARFGDLSSSLRNMVNKDYSSKKLAPDGGLFWLETKELKRLKRVDPEPDWWDVNAGGFRTN